MNLRTVYLLMAIVGTVVPLMFFASFGAEEGISLTGFVAAAFVNGAAGGLTADLLISSFVFWIYMWTKRDSGPIAWPFVILNLFIGLSCALPAYLWLRAKTVASEDGPV